MGDDAAVEAAVRQTQARYTDAVWRKDLDALGDCLTADSQWRIAGRVFDGRAAVVAHMRSVFPQFRRIFMTFRTPVLEIAGGQANARTFVTEQSVFAGGRPFFAIGIYWERYVQEGERWRAAWRLFQTQYAGPADLSAAFHEAQDFGPPPGMPPLDAPTYSQTGVHDKDGH
jgi:hypothetical protein